jgi:hypothetical protein
LYGQGVRMQDLGRRVRGVVSSRTEWRCVTQGEGPYPNVTLPYLTLPCPALPCPAFSVNPQEYSRQDSCEIPTTLSDLGSIASRLESNREEKEKNTRLGTPILSAERRWYQERDNTAEVSTGSSEFRDHTSGQKYSHQAN